MASRLELQTELETLLGSRNVYYQPPESTKMMYPAIVYSKSNIKITYADGRNYINKNSYELIVIDKKPDNPVINLLLELPMCNYDRHYISENLNHDVLTLFY